MSMDLRRIAVGWALGAVVGLGVVWFDVNLWAAVPVVFVVTFLAALTMTEKPGKKI